MADAHLDKRLMSSKLGIVDAAINTQQISRHGYSPVGITSYAHGEFYNNVESPLTRSVFF